jgi:hypothetical protein
MQVRFLPHPPFVLHQSPRVEQEFLRLTQEARTQSIRDD